MNEFFNKQRDIFTIRKRIFAFLTSFLCICAVLLGCACKKESVDYFSYASEICDNILLADNETISVRVYAVNRETPYLADGIPRERTARAEFFLVAPSGDKECILTFTVDGKKWGGDTSYDSVKAQYYYSCSIDISKLKSLPIEISYGTETYTLTAQSVKTDDTLTPRKIVERLRTEKPTIFSNLTDEYGFSGEIYIRLLHEESLYYYVGVTNREGKTHAFLFNARTGKLLAERKP